MSRFAKSTLIVAVFFGLEKVLGFARQIIIARQFGLSSQLDAFNAANNLPDLLFALISGGALGIAFIPVLTETLQKARPPGCLGPVFPHRQSGLSRHRRYCRCAGHPGRSACPPCGHPWVLR